MSDAEWKNRGKTREKNLTREVYFDEHYFSLQQLTSLAYQIQQVHQINPQDILEVGLGNGFVSSFLIRAGYNVLTADINPVLEPDICAPLDQLLLHLDGREFDLTVCFEVLEHMPFEDFEENVSILRATAPKLLMSLPNYARSFGIGGLIRLPKIAARPFGWYIDVTRRKDLAKTQHFWEVGSEKATSTKEIIAILNRHYGTARTWRNPMNPYHIFFFAAS